MPNETLDRTPWEKWPLKGRFTLRSVITEDQTVKAVEPMTPIVNAAALFGAGVDLVVVCTSQGQLVGVLTKSDLVGHLARQGTLDCSTETVMSKDVVTGGLDDQVHELWRRMVERGIKNLPIVTESGAPVAVLTRSRASDLLLASLEAEDAMLQDYVMGIGYQ